MNLRIPQTQICDDIVLGILGEEHHPVFPDVDGGTAKSTRLSQICRS